MENNIQENIEKIFKAIKNEKEILKKENKKKYIKSPTEIKKKKNFINNEIEINNVNSSDYILDKIILNQNIYYKDKENNVLDENTNLVGFYKNNENECEYFLFN